MKEQLRQFFEEKFGQKADSWQLTKLHGDASYRTYFRANLGPGKTFIVMQLPAGQASVSEEITNLREKPRDLPFLEIARYLGGLGLPVPQVHHYDSKNRFLILEDLGDETLEKRVSLKPKEKESWYKKAIDLLVEMQRRTRLDSQARQASEKGRCIAFQRSFDETLFNWELDHFREYGIEIRLNRKIGASDLSLFEKYRRQIASVLTKMPTVFTHRDYQSRNLMIHREKLYLLDFQDALIGPMVYDLVALLRDSYIVLEPDLVDELLHDYLEKRGETVSLDFSSLRMMFDWVTIQRKLKDAGRFVYIDRVKGNRGFLPSIPASLAYVKEAFTRQKSLGEFFELLKKYVPEFS
ncbi:MAG: phosphotransferase [Deltaproteobacteria bacterium]|nr:phosphotransferase [Deltaproteobacteria bacterium]